MIEISVDTQDRVLIRWHGRGPLLVVTEDGTITEQHNDGGAVTVWDEAIDHDEVHQQALNQAYEDGQKAGVKAERTRARNRARQDGQVAR